MRVLSVDSKSSPGAASPRLSRPETLNFADVDAVSLAIFTDKQLHRKVSALGKLDLTEVRAIVEKAIERYRADVPRPSAQHIHDKVMAGFSGEALIISSALLLDTLRDTERFFHISFKTIKAKLGQSLGPASSELALRMTRATLYAAQVFGNLEAARIYLRTKNFALGGAAPIDLLQTAEGARIVLNELQTQADGGPL